MSAAAGPGGDVYAEYRYGNSDPPRFAAGLSRWRSDDRVENMTLVDVAGEPGQYMSGDDYGAIAAAADGSVWMAWSDPRRSPDERIAVARVHPTGR